MKSTVFSELPAFSYKREVAKESSGTLFITIKLFHIQLTLPVNACS